MDCDRINSWIYILQLMDYPFLIFLFTSIPSSAYLYEKKDRLMVCCGIEVKIIDGIPKDINSITRM